MSFAELWAEIIISLKTNLLRSALTVLGILIGVSSVVALVSIGEGAQKNVLEQIRSVGTNLLVVLSVPTGQPTAGPPVLLDQKDVEVIAGYKNVKMVAPENSRVFPVTHERKSAPALIVGTLFNYQEIRNIKLAEGSFFSEQAERNAARVAIIGGGIRKQIFADETEALEKSVTINGLKFKIIGVMTEKGESGGQNLVIIPLTSLKRYLLGDRYFSAINLTADNETNVAELKNSIINYFSTVKGSASGIQVVTQNDLILATTQTTKVLSFLLGAIASISLLVGGIGIMNMMFTSVIERTKEIGLRRAIGATQKDIKKQFLAESVVICFVGAILGIPLGWLGSYIFTKLAGIIFVFSFWAVGLALILAFVIGLLFGYLPAKKASKVTPVEALRYE